MDFYNNFSITSQFNYGKQHFQNAKVCLNNSSFGSKLKGIGELCLCALEMIPLVGIVPAYMEKKFTNLTRVKQRENFINQTIHSKSFQAQSVYFDTLSSARTNRHILSLDSELRHFDNSSVDLQLYSLIEDLTAFEEENGSAAFNDVLKKLEDAKQTALLITSITKGTSPENKEAGRMELESHIRSRILSMPVGESIIIPSGYMNGNIYDLEGINEGRVNGHAFQLKLVKEENGTYTIKIFNTGEGESLHPKDSAKTDHVFPYTVVNILEEDLLNGDFLQNLTKFSYTENGSPPYSSKDVYECINRIGQFVPETGSERSYHTQGLIGNCTKKSLQVWMHDEMKNDENIYQKFRVFRLERQVNGISPLINSSKDLKYTHQMASLGVSSTFSNRKFLSRRIATFFLGSQIKINISKETIEHLNWYAKQVNEIRKGKLENGDVDGKKIPLYLFRNNESVEKDLEVILNHSNKNLLLKAYGEEFTSKAQQRNEVIRFIPDIKDKVIFLSGHVNKLIEDKKWDQALEVFEQLKNFEDVKFLPLLFNKMAENGEVGKAVSLLEYFDDFSKDLNASILMMMIDTDVSNASAIEKYCKFESTQYEKMALTALGNRIDKMLNEGKSEELIQISSNVAPGKIKNLILEKVNNI